MILKVSALSISFIIICLGILTILGGHITPGGGFQGGAMIAAGIVLTLLVYGLEKNPFHLSHEYVIAVENISALGYVGLGLVGLAFSGFYLYNIGADIYSLVPSIIATIFHYPDTTNAGIVPYLNIFVGLKVLVGLATVAIAFQGFDKIREDH
jgi:energy-converting hydrogenase B subunit I